MYQRKCMMIIHGLGLSIVTKILETNKGQLLLNNYDNQGNGAEVKMVFKRSKHKIYVYPINVKKCCWKNWFIFKWINSIFLVLSIFGGLGLTFTVMKDAL